MGDICSKDQNRVNVDIIGNGNSAFVVNGLAFNLTSILETAITLTIKKYRIEVMVIQLVSFCLVLLSVFMTGRYCVSHHKTEKDISEEQHVQRTKYKIVENQNADCVTGLETEILEYQNHFEKLEDALNELNHILLYDTKNAYGLKNSMECIEKMYDIAQTSSSMSFFVTMKLIDKKYANLCIIVLKKNINCALWCREAWQTTCNTLYYMYRYMKLSSNICHNAIVAGIIPFLTSYISEASQLKNLDTTHSIAVIFEIILRIFHTIAQIEEMRYHLINDNCGSILLHVAEHTKNKLFRCIIFLTVAQLNEDNTIKIPLTNDDATVLFRLYYECVVSKSQMTYGLQHTDILNGFFAFGRSEYHSFNIERN